MANEIEMQDKPLKDIYLDLSDPNDYTDCDDLSPGTFHDKENNAFCQMEIYESDTDSNDIILSNEDIFASHYRMRQCPMVAYILLSLLVIVSFIAFTIVVSVLLIPYVKATHFAGTVCNVTEVTEYSTESICSCDENCEVLIPCLVITVVYNDVHSNTHNATLYDNELLLDRQCSFYPSCENSLADDLKNIKSYKTRYGNRRHPYHCLYDPADTFKVIRTRQFQLYHVIHGMTWSSLILVTSVLLFWITFRIKRFR